MEQTCLDFQIETVIDVVGIKQVKESSFTYKTSIKSPNDVEAVIKEFLKDRDREYFIVLCLNTKGYVNNLSVISIGSLSSTIVTPREVFKVAILSNAASIIIAHNHPSGIVAPSEEDKKVTQILIEAGELLGISVLDSIIVGDQGDKVFSFKENELM